MKKIKSILLALCLVFGLSLTSISAKDDMVIQPLAYQTTTLTKTAKIYTTINGVSNTYWISAKLSVNVTYESSQMDIKTVSTPTISIISSYLPSGYKLGSLEYDDIRSAVINSNNTVTAIAGFRVPVKTSSGASTSYSFPGGTSYYYLSFSNWSI